MKKASRYWTGLIMAAYLAMSLTGCGGLGAADAKDASVSVEDSSQAVRSLISQEDAFTDRDLEGGYDEMAGIKINLTGDTAESDSEAVQVSGSIVTIKEEGTYLLSGALHDGMIVVEADDSAKVQLVLDGASVNSGKGAAVYVKSARKVFLTLAEGSENSLTSGGSCKSSGGSNVDGAVFAKSDVTVNGPGSLSVRAEEGHGIVSKEDLKITGGQITVKAARQGLSGKDSICIAGGTISITSGRDGIRAKGEGAEKGYVYIAGGSLSIDAQGDGISADAFLQIDGGTFAVTAGGGSGDDRAMEDEDGEALSTKGIKASGAMLLNDGSFVIDAWDDALHSNDSITLWSGTYRLATGDDGIHADGRVSIAGGTIEITDSYEGVEGNEVVISGGNLTLHATDDGINAAGGRDGSGFEGAAGVEDGHFEDIFGQEEPSIQISGGKIHINADGDGVDSNGSLLVTGGELYISGPVDDRNGALDYDGEACITGGIVVAAGSSGMAVNFGDSSTQGSILVSVPRQENGGEIVLKDAAGKALLTYMAEKAFDSVVVSSPELVLGGRYRILAGDSETEVILEELIYGKGH